MLLMDGRRQENERPSQGRATGRAEQGPRWVEQGVHAPTPSLTFAQTEAHSPGYPPTCPLSPALQHHSSALNDPTQK